jgi:hypothetical protein
MRFSDMMGSGDEKSSKHATPESEALIADALAPYLNASASNSATAEPVAAFAPPEPPAPPEVPVVAVASVAPVTPAMPFTAVAPVAPVVPPDPIAATIADFAPISDDLLPHRR